MKIISLDNVKNELAEALKQQRCDEPILLTAGSDEIGLLLPEGMKESDIDSAVWLEEPAGHLVVVIQTKHNNGPIQHTANAQPVFGSCNGMLTIVSEDDEHLKDFQEYMQ